MYNKKRKVDITVNFLDGVSYLSHEDNWKYSSMQKEKREQNAEIGH